MAVIITNKNAFPAQDEREVKSESSFSRYKQVVGLGWIALLGPLAYGVLEAMLNSNLPVYALRKGWSVSEVSFLLPAFAVGGIITQIPLGILSDKYGRDRILTWTFCISTGIFLFAAVFDQYYWIVFACMLLAGMVIGSCFSLGLGFMTDLLPRHLLPAGNILSGIAFSLGSILGPVLGGVFIEKYSIQAFYCGYDYNRNSRNVIYVLHEESIRIKKNRK